MKRLFHTPEGVRDVYSSECEQKLYLQSKLHRVFKKYKYQDIETPTFEFFDVFSKEVGTTPSKDLYKFFDREGNTLVLRPDFTPSIARAAAMYFEEKDMPVRLCYQGSVFVNNSSYQGRLKESTQMGVEFIGDSSVEADVEVISMAIEMLLDAGLTEFQISIGQVDFFKALIEEAQMSADTVEMLRTLISNKNTFGVQDLINSLSIREGLKEAFFHLPQLFGTTDVLEKARKFANNGKARDAIRRLSQIYTLMEAKGYEKYISFDFGMLSKYEYYTGIIFHAYTYGTGEPIAKGGRYDNLMAHFGKPEPAVGFGLTMEQLMIAMSRQNIAIDPKE